MDKILAPYLTLPTLDGSLVLDQVHVWRVSLDQAYSTIAHLAAGLSSDERNRAGRYHSTQDKEHFIVRRGFLRIALSHYLDSNPSELLIGTSVYGKPTIVTSTYGDSLRFNTSSSEGICLCAITRNREIGIDIERVRPIDQAERIAEHFFSPQEVYDLFSVPANQRVRAFLQGWTRKEAYLKAVGCGLSQPTRSISVSLKPDKPAELLAVDTDPQELNRWSLLDISIPGQYAAALCVEGYNWRVAFGEFTSLPLP